MGSHVSSRKSESIIKVRQLYFQTKPRPCHAIFKHSTDSNVGFDFRNWKNMIECKDVMCTIDETCEAVEN